MIINYSPNKVLNDVFDITLHQDNIQTLNDKDQLYVDYSLNEIKIWKDYYLMFNYYWILENKYDFSKTNSVECNQEEIYKGNKDKFSSNDHGNIFENKLLKNICLLNDNEILKMQYENIIFDVDEKINKKLKELELLLSDNNNAFLIESKMLDHKK